ncbi:MAG: PKD domain-containing protein [Planctomycetes bacterium]|nr:PKD domain-containing protein [Planctomycetota bacterium]
MKPAVRLPKMFEELHLKIRRGGLWAVLVAVSSRFAAAQEAFSEPRQMSDGSGLAAQASLGVDLGQNAYVAMVIQSRIVVHVLGTTVDFTESPLDGVLGQGDPVVETNAVGVTYIAFTQEDDEAGAEGREILLTSNAGGRFRQPANLSSNQVDDSAPQLFIDKLGAPHLVWAQSEGFEQRVVYYNHTQGKIVPVGAGDYPDLALEETNNTVHVVYKRVKTLYYVNNKSGGFTGEIPVFQNPGAEAFSSGIGVASSGVVFVVYESGGIIFMAVKSGVVFDAPKKVVEGGVINPDFQLKEQFLSIAYENGGDLYYIAGSPQQFLPPVQVTHTPEIETHPSLRVDLQGTFHLSFLREGEVYYSNNSSKPVAQFKADPEGGEVPVRVQFTDQSSGDIRIWKWNFGDGQTSNEKNPAHLYGQTGKYSVKLEVSGPGGSSEQLREDYIFVQDRINTMRIPPIAVFPGQQKVWVPVIGTFKEAIQGFQITGRYDPRILTLVDVTYNTTYTGSGRPEFFETVRSDDPADPYFNIGMLVDAPEPPFENRRLLPADDRRIVNLVFNISTEAPQGKTTLVELKNGLGPNKLSCVYIVDGIERIPGLTSGTVSILRVLFPLPRSFIRGDVDGDGQPSITDAIDLLQYLFLGTYELRCEDAADPVDAGQLDISGAIAILSYLFLGGQEPAPPFPNPGLDATEDALNPCAF